MSEIKLKIDGKEFTGTSGETIYEVASRNGIQIPVLCHDPKLKPYTSCYVCVVQVEGMRGMQPSCSTRINDGMIITTNSKEVRKARKTALDLLLSNHYADCLGPCKQTCPAGVDVQGYVSLIDKGLFKEAIALIKDVNPLPAICGRVCVRPCEAACRRNLLDEGSGAGVDYLKRFAADKDLVSDDKFMPEVEPSTGKKVAVIGGGPGGLSAAFFLQQKGHQCDIYEAAPQAGGWLRYGIPEYRLPNEILDKEIDTITELGVNIYTGKKLGENLPYKEIHENYDATILTIGSQKGTKIGCEGDDAENVYSGIDFLRNMEMTGQRPDFSGKTIVTVGGGNTAMDCCRTAMRLGAKKSYVVYRRTEKEMPANPIEIHESKLEGIEYLFLTNPVKVNKDEKGRIKSLTLIKMELGEPDTSGRRRPVPVEGSEYDLEVDFALAAIGQKTDINFLDDVNSVLDDGSELMANKWGDIDAVPNTLQTGVDSIFAAGDGVTGPATIIEAIAQAKIAARSCHQYLAGEEIIPEKREFLSKRDNFQKQIEKEYIHNFERHLRNEMPILDSTERKNFNEVELGYANEEVACSEASRCLECGCAEYFTCDLKKYADEYFVEQQKYKGDYNKYDVDFSHPYIEIDNNKCILCAKCMRVCDEVVGAKALGLINRGFDTYVAPSLGESLKDTSCETCGLCIDICPTGAISENFEFKPGPVETDSIKAICNYCSVGCELDLRHKGGFVMETIGSEGLINSDGNICKYGKFGYSYLNDGSRITKPMYKRNGRFEEITFDEAFKIIKQKVLEVAPDENAVFAGARLTNEELYLVQKLTRAGFKTNNIGSYHYFDNQDAYENNWISNVPYQQIRGAGKIYLIGAELNEDNPVVGFIVNNTKVINEVPVYNISEKENSSMEEKVTENIKVKSYYYTIKAINHYLISHNLQNQMFLSDNCEEFENYKTELQKENYSALVEKSGISAIKIREIAESYNNEMNAVIILSEKYLTGNSVKEIFNLSLITGKLGKTGSGIIALKEKNNSQGIYDMGIRKDKTVGNQELTGEVLEKLSSVWKTTGLSNESKDIKYELLMGHIKNLFIFGEDPVGCAIDKLDSRKWINADFLVVQDYFVTDTAREADLILPASLPFESGGSYTNSQKIIQQFDAAAKPKVEQTNTEQFINLSGEFGVNGISEKSDIISEIAQTFPEEKDIKYVFETTAADKKQIYFKHGCDYVHKYFEDKFEDAFN
ncbi:MAG: molybdopterin-dependent oxidoreductase [Rhodothermaceae bacterium]